MTNREKLLKRFTEEYDRLNPEQRKAVDGVEGPVMVIAGPGTGKTQILSARIGRILLSDAQVEPQNILCLTYTDAGVVAMRRRLQTFIGPDAYKVAIHTFHAFCNEVIQDNLALFEKTALDPISDLERIELLKELIDGFPKDHPLKRYRGDVYFEISGLQSLFSLMKREGWTGDYICQKIDDYLNDLPNRDEYICKRATKTFKKGDVRTDKIDEQRERMEKLRAACNEFKKFNELMRGRNRYDFDDMIAWVIDAFENNETLLRTYQEQFQYILVDEYQDTSGSQNRIVQLLISFWDKPNVFVVGDDDQSIYRFQGANVENMLAFAQGYEEDLLTVVLTSNYRSTQPILDVSKALIDRNEERLVKKIAGLSKELVSRVVNGESSMVKGEVNGESSVVSADLNGGSSMVREELANGKESGIRNQQSEIPRPEAREYLTVREEMIGVTLAIEKLIGQGVAGSDIAVIYRENRYGEELANYLRLKGLPYFTKRNLNILEQPVIRQLLTVLDYLAAEHDMPYGGDELLFEILHFEWWGIPPVEIAKASMLVSEENYQNRGQNRTSLRRYVCDRNKQAPRDLFDTGLNKKLCEAVHQVEGLIAAVRNETLQNLLEKVIREGGFLSHIVNHPEKAWLLQVVTAFYNHVKDETRRHPYITLDAFLNRIGLMRKEGLVLPLVQVAGNEKGVNLLTSHGSKGLEYEHVFFVGCNASSWEKKRKPYSGFSFPDTLFASNAAGNDTEELRRLFYVALTRAKQHLTISYSAHTEEGKLLEPSMFLAEINEAIELRGSRVTLDSDVVADFAALQFSERLAPEVAALDEELVTRATGNFVMNVSALNNYLRCPLEFYFRNVVRIPSPKNEAAEFGSAVHHALEHLFHKQKEKGALPPVTELLSDFTWYMNRHRESFTREQFARRLEYGTEILKNYYMKYSGTFNAVNLIEHNIRNVSVDGLLLKGKLDKIEFRGKEATIVDYKTGDPEKSKEKFARPNPRIPNGGDYWRQAVFYKLMIEAYKPDWNTVAIEFDFIEPTKKKDYHREQVVVNEMDVSDVKEQIRTVYEKIRNKDFYTGCGKEDCHWCGFVKTNKLAVALHDLKEETEEPARFVMRVVENQ
jgi:DNA helicase-2/ATP-dependent DNA helicase PcrA